MSVGPVWQVEHDWEERWIAHYVRRVPDICRRYFSSGRQFTCEDFPLEVIIQFASYYKLPFGFVTGSSIFNSKRSPFRTVREFTNSVKLRTGAQDFLNPMNSVTRPGQVGSFEMLRMARPGDIIYSRTSSGFGHIQLVSEVTRGSITIVQGNFNSSWDGRFGASSDPRSERYLGAFLQTGKYDLSDTGLYTRAGQGVHYRPFLTHGRVLQWNFGSWNSLRSEAPVGASTPPGNVGAGDLL